MKEIDQHRPRDGKRQLRSAPRSRSLHHCNANDQQRFSSVPLLAHLFPLLFFFLLYVPLSSHSSFFLALPRPTTISASPTTLNSTRVSTQLRSEDRRGLLSPRATLTRAGADGRLDWRALWARARFSSVHRRSRPLFSLQRRARATMFFPTLRSSSATRERREFPSFLERWVLRNLDPKVMVPPQQTTTVGAVVVTESRRDETEKEI